MKRRSDAAAEMFFAAVCRDDLSQWERKLHDAIVRRRETQIRRYANRKKDQRQRGTAA